MEFKPIHSSRYSITNLYFNILTYCNIIFGGFDYSNEQTLSHNLIYVVKEGSCKLKIYGETYTLKKGMYTLIPKNTQYKVYNLSDDIERIMIGVEFVQKNTRLEKDIINASKIKQLYDVSDNFNNILSLIYNYAKSKNTGYVTIIENAISIAVFEVMHTMNIKLKKSSNDKRTENTDTINHIIHFIEENITSKITASDVADNFNISVRQLDRLIIKHKGVTVKKIIDLTKLTAAQDFIINSKYSLFGISMHLGFSSLHSFNAFFKRLTGTTPSEYMKNHRPQ